MAEVEQHQWDATDMNEKAHLPSGTGSETSSAPPRVQPGADVEQDVLNRISTQSLKEPRLPTWRLVCLYISICSGLLLAFLDTSIVATALYTIGVEFHSLDKINWIALAYTLAYLGCTAIFASLSDVFGRRNAYMAASIIFLAFSLGCGFAQSLNQLIAFRALQGIGGSGLYSIAFVILPEISPVKMIKLIGAVAGAVVAISGVLGPVLGGVITNYTTWRWIFWINAPIGIGPLILFIIAYPPPSQFRPMQRGGLRQIDILGFILLIAASVLFTFPFQEGGIRILSNPNSWRSALFLAPLIVSIFCWIALFAWERTISRRWEDSISALFPMRLAKSRVYVCALIATMLMGFPYFAMIYSLPIRFQVINGKSALDAGVALLPMLGSSAVGSTVGGALSGAKNRTFPVMLVAACLMVIGTATFSTLGNTLHPQAKTYGFQVFVGLSFGLTVSTTALLAAVECEPKDRAPAQGLMAQTRMLGGSVGIAASTAILAAKQRNQLLEKSIVTPEQLQSLRAAIHTLSAQQIHDIRQTYTDSFNETMVVCAIVSAVCVLVTLGCWQKDPPTLESRRRQQLQEEKMSQATASVAETGRGTGGEGQAH